MRFLPSRLMGLFTLGIPAALLSACDTSSTEPASPLVYDLTVELTRIYVVGDCETAAGNPGEFAWRAHGEVSAPLGASDRYETTGFPAESGARTYGEDDGPVELRGASLQLPGIASEDLDRVLLTFSVVEWDQGSHDPEMQFRQVTVTVPFAETPGVNAVDVGDRNACKLSFEFRRTWTAS